MIAPEYFWLSVFLLGIGTFSIRYSLVSISGRIKIDDRARALFSYIPSAVLPALVAPMVFYHQGSVAWLAGKERAAVLVLAIMVCAFSRSTLATIVCGLLGLYLVRLM